ncbi:MAG: hypothetical protein PHV85_10795 [Desulfovibrionaceae bacterium]|nr:hypothetical protein [Desulfovibrionaceae bacterium]MDD4953026.1 hypothetical protein [Desulfovibrionaceae bacterium]
MSLKTAVLPLAALAVAVSLCAQAATIRESDLIVQSRVKKVVVQSQGKNVKSEAKVHEIEVQEGSETGRVVVKGQAGEVFNTARGMNVQSSSTVGGVKVGGK